MSRTIPKFVYGEIYVLTCVVNKKQYIGKTMSHRYKSYKDKWVSFGSNGRFKEHVWEAYSQKKTQSYALNNAIKKYGENKFTIEVIYKCTINWLDYFERLFISIYDTYNNGYNLNKGGWGGALHYSVYERSSKTRNDYYDNQRRSKIEKIFNRITKVFIDDNTTDMHLVIMTIYENDSILYKWSFTNKDGDMWDSYLRAYYILYGIIPHSKIIVSRRLSSYLDYFEEFFDDLLEPNKESPPLTATNTSSIDIRYNRYCTLKILWITLKLRKSRDCNIIAVCIRSSCKSRETVSEFGGDGVSYQWSLDNAIALSKKLTTDDKISIRPELVAFIKTQKLYIEYIPKITRKPRNMFNKK